MYKDGKFYVRLGLPEGASFPTSPSHGDVFLKSGIVYTYLSGISNWEEIADYLSGDISITDGVVTVIKLQNRAVADIAPESEEVLTWDGAQWLPSGVITDLSGDVTVSEGVVTVIGIQEQPVSTTDPQGNEVLVWNGAEWIPSGITLSYSGGSLDHGILIGLGDDDHTQYLLADGTRIGATGQAQDFGANGIVLEAIEFDGTTGVNIITVPDNTADAFSIEDDGGIEYIRILSTNANPYLYLFPGFDTGQVIIGDITDPGIYRLHVTGSIYATSSLTAQGTVVAGLTVRVGYYDIDSDGNPLELWAGDDVDPNTDYYYLKTSSLDLEVWRMLSTDDPTPVQCAYIDSSSGWQAGSQRKLKTSIEAITNFDRFLEDLDQLTLYSYERKDKLGLEEVGVLAEEAPHLMLSGDQTGINYTRAIGYLLGVVKGQQAQIQELQIRREL